MKTFTRRRWQGGSRGGESALGEEKAKHADRKGGEIEEKINKKILRGGGGVREVYIRGN